MKKHIFSIMMSIFVLLVASSMMMFESNYNVLENVFTNKVYTIGKGSIFDLMPLSYSIGIPVYDIARILFIAGVLTAIVAAVSNMYTTYKQAHTVV